MKSLKILFSLIICFALVHETSGQNFVIKGEVKDKATGEGLPFANVFMTKTTFGTTTTKEGAYIFEVPNPGTYDLVVSFVGFKTYTTKITLSASKVIDLDVTLEEESTNLGDFIVKGRKDKAWARKMIDFKKYFLGQSSNARKSRILNEEVIDFVDDPTGLILQAAASEPILIENQALGYKVEYFLEEFKVDYGKGISSFYGYTKFEELVPTNEKKKKKWQRARTEAYNGSSLHFFAALYDNRLAVEGFEVHKARYADGYGIVVENEEFNPYTITKKNKASISHSIAFKEYLHITYIYESEGLDYIAATKGTVLEGQQVANMHDPDPQRSWISLLDVNEPIEFEGSGYIYNPVSFLLQGYWGFEKAADMIPINFLPVRRRQP